MSLFDMAQSQLLISSKQKGDSQRRDVEHGLERQVVPIAVVWCCVVDPDEFGDASRISGVAEESWDGGTWGARRRQDGGQRVFGWRRKGVLLTLTAPVDLLYGAKADARDIVPLPAELGVDEAVMRDRAERDAEYDLRCGVGHRCSSCAGQSAARF